MEANESDTALDKPMGNVPLGKKDLSSMSISLQVWRHPAGGEREKHVGDDPHGTGALSKGAAGQNHPDHRLLARQPAVAALRAPS